MTLSVVCLSVHSATGPGDSEEVLASWAESTSVGRVAGIAIGNPAVDSPASVNPGTRARASASKVRVRPISVDNDAIPAVALRAYQRAAVIMAQSDTRCGLTWELLAAIGRVESDHGRFGKSSLDKQGVAAPAIIGLPLNGKKGTAKIRDTDAGVLDQDTRHDRAVGPMQFIPSTWSVVGVDADGDSKRNPQDVDDAALAAAVHLCGGTERLDTPAGLRAAVLRYNHSTAYADMVIDLADQYAAGNYSAPPTTSTSTQITPPTAARADNGPEAKPDPDRGPTSEARPGARPGAGQQGSESTRTELQTSEPGKGDGDKNRDKRDGHGKLKSDPQPEVGSTPVKEKPEPPEPPACDDPGLLPHPNEPGDCLPPCVDANGDGTYDPAVDGLPEGDTDGVPDANADGLPDECVVPSGLGLAEELTAPVDESADASPSPSSTPAP